VTGTMRVLLATVAAAGCLAEPAYAKHIDKEFRHVFPATPGTVLHLVHGDGKVRVTSWEKDSVLVAVSYRADVQKVGWGKDPDFEVAFRQNESTLDVVAKQSGGSAVGFLSISHEDYRIEVHAPATVTLDFEGTDGEVTLEAWRADITLALKDGKATLRDVVAGQVRVSMDDGRVTLDGIHADVFLHGKDAKALVEDVDIPKGDLHLEDGDLTITNARGSFDLDLEDGDLHMNRSRLDNASIHTEDGDVDLDLLPSEHFDLDVFTRSGSVRIELESGSSVHFSAETKGGRLRVNLPGATGLRESRDRLSGDWNGGNGRLRVITIDGPVDLRQRSR
jgi:putative adhesin